MTNYTDILKPALEQPVSAERPIGCCRIYVTVPQEHANDIAKAARSLRLIFQRKAHYDLRNAIYVGHDNCDGRTLARGAAIVAALKAAGVQAHREECGD